VLDLVADIHWVLHEVGSASMAALAADLNFELNRSCHETAWPAHHRAQRHSRHIVQTVQFVPRRNPLLFKGFHLLYCASVGLLGGLENH